MIHVLRTCLALSCLLPAQALSQSSFVNWESPHVHPIDLGPGRARIAAVNTADNRVEIFSLTGGLPTSEGAVPVGLDPVSVRFRTADEVWVVNHLSDSVSIVDLPTRRVRATLATADEPADVVFAGTPERAFVSCSQANRILVFDPLDLEAPPIELEVDAEEPKALAVSPDGQTVYAAIFESGNGTTVLGGPTLAGGFPPNVVSHPAGPYGGQNPPPNDGSDFSPPLNPQNPAPPQGALIVRKSASGSWLDDNGGDWTALVSGPQAALSGRPVGWDLPDRDIALIDTASLGLSYATRLMNIGMALAVDPVSGEALLVGTDATNEVRFEPNLKGTFVRVMMARISADGSTTVALGDLNPHLDYHSRTLPQAQRDLSIGDPRAVAFRSDGSEVFIAGMGSNNLITIDVNGARTGAPIEVGQGPTGLALDDEAERLYVLNKFEASISVVDTQSRTELARIAFYDPTPQAIRDGRPFLYDTHLTSGLGQSSCASCHVDARWDRLGWDLGDPSGALADSSDQNVNMGLPLGGGDDQFHPMKGVMTTQTLQDIIGLEPFHWRGDRDGIEAFNPAFVSLLGDDTQLSAPQLQAFKEFLASLHFPPNPYRELDNGLPTDLPLPGHFTSGVHSPAGQPLPNGNAQAGLELYRPPNLLDGNGLACVTCHTLPTGVGPDAVLTGGVWTPLPPGPNGERHHGLLGTNTAGNDLMKIPQLRNMYEKVGFDLTQTRNAAGFGFVHDGVVDSLSRFITEPVFTTQNEQEVADLLAFLLCFSGSDLPQGSATSVFEPPGSAGRDTHAAVGQQLTVKDASSASNDSLARLDFFEGLADSGAVGLVVKGLPEGLASGYTYLGNGSYQSDRLAETIDSAALRDGAAPGSELTWTVVPKGSEERIGVDRDEDGYYDRDELDAGSDPADPGSTPGNGPDELHVEGIALLTLGSLPLPGGLAIGAVRVGNQHGQSVSGVSVQVQWSGAQQVAGQATTGSDGVAWLRGPAALGSGLCWRLTVTDLVAPPAIYDPGANVETSDATDPSCP